MSLWQHKPTTGMTPGGGPNEQGNDRMATLYGGREKPSQTGYVANKNLYNQVKCAPCWLRNPCDFDRKCMDMIQPPQVIAAAAEQIAKYGTLLEVQTANL